MENKKTKILILGAGPAGLALSILLKRSNLDFIIVDKNFPGGKLHNISKINNLPGIKSISGTQFASQIYEHALDLGIEVLHVDFLSAKKSENGIFIFTSNDLVVSCEYVVFAIGKTMSPLNVPGFKKFWQKGISSCAICDGFLYRNQPIAVIGNNEISKQEINYLKNLTDEIYTIDEMSEKIISFNGDDKLSEIVTEKNRYSIAAAFVYTRETINSKLIYDLNLQVENNAIKVNYDTRETSEKNIYAIGDCIQKKVYQIVGAFDDASVVNVMLINAMNHEKH